MGHVLKELSIVHVNIQGFYSSRAELDVLIDKLKTAHYYIKQDVYKT